MVHRIVKYFILISFVFGFISTGLNAETISAASCSREDVQSAINSASDDDIVIVPAGSCTWVGGPNNDPKNSSGIYIKDKRITIFGAGIDSTVISLDSQPPKYIRDFG